ncbi:unnamed protein product [Hermetia illucens]|uniref:Reverse transcriptase domain-containing protein n=1 Tax=Hermetia illucens TaxID=343691 RepID=A0A7R8YXX2_HERIL|nr:unnamed protein product [Hermetia illucens]
MFAKVFTACLREGEFPEKWKLQKLILFPKPGKPLGDPSSYRPIYLVSTIGKLFEKVLYNRLLAVAEKEGGLSDKQFGFRKGRSTIDAINMVTGLARAAIQDDKCCAVVTLDVKNAFNTAKWTKIVEALTKPQAPKYIVRIVVAFLLGRRLYCNSDDGEKFFPMTCGVPQGSVLGPLLWLIMYNGVLTLRLPSGVTTIGFADDIGVTIVAKHLDEIEIYANEAIWEINSWLKKSGLSLAEHKTELVLISKRRKDTTVKIKVGEKTIYSQESLKYLGVIIDKRLDFKKHIECAATKASSIAVTISRILPNIGRPRQSRLRLISKVVSSVLLYAAPVWAPVLENKSNCGKLGMAYRLSALRVCSAYRTTSGEAAYVLAGTIPIDILADEGRRLYDKMYAIGESIVLRRQLARRESIANWQKRWNEAQTGRWTYRIIPHIRRWMERNHRELSYELTQFLSGHSLSLSIWTRRVTMVPKVW